MKNAQRLEKLRPTLDEQDLDAVLISQPENRRYLTGFTGSAGWLVLTHDRAAFATDFRYLEQFGRESPGFELVKIKTKFVDTLPDMLDNLGVKRLGFESQHVTVDDHCTWQRATEDVAWVALKDTVEKLRMVKDEGEIEILRRSAVLTDAAFARLLEVIEPGMTELEAAWVIESAMRTMGASKVAFDLIVASGPNGALPHAQPGNRKIAEGEPIVIDIGSIVDGYCSDMTRTICLGEASAKYEQVWDIVLEAQQAALDALCAGMTGKEADSLARDVISRAGYGEQFGHGLGHSVGLAVHENPRASKLSEDILEAGMSLTVEPGIYLPGEFGVRTEDLVIIREKGIEILSGTSKNAFVR